jgi:heptosyltransferase-2
VARRVGYARDARSILLTDALLRPTKEGRFQPTYMVDYYLELCRAAGIREDGREMALPYSDDDARRAERILEQQGLIRDRPLLLLHPGAGYGPSKRWPVERWARLAEHLDDRFGAQIALVAGPAERAAVLRIRDGSRAAITDLTDCGVDLHLLKCVVARSGLLVTTDSGPRHYGVALGVPTVCVMGPTHPGYSTSSRPHDHVVRLDVDCGPCQRRRCPRDHRCMADITAEMVLEACDRALSDAPGGKST